MVHRFCREHKHAFSDANCEALAPVFRYYGPNKGLIDEDDFLELAKVLFGNAYNEEEARKQFKEEDKVDGNPVISMSSALNAISDTFEAAVNMTNANLADGIQTARDGIPNQQVLDWEDPEERNTQTCMEVEVAFSDEDCASLGPILEYFAGDDGKVDEDEFLKAAKTLFSANNDYNPTEMQVLFEDIESAPSEDGYATVPEVLKMINDEYLQHDVTDEQLAQGIAKALKKLKKAGLDTAASTTSTTQSSGSTPGNTADLDTAASTTSTTQSSGSNPRNIESSHQSIPSPDETDDITSFAERITITTILAVAIMCLV